MAYCSVTELKQYLGINEATDDTLLQALIARAQAAINAHTGRNFEAKTETRYYGIEDVEGDYLYLDEDLISVTTLTNGDSSGTTITSTYYWLWPRNDSPPYFAIKLKATGTTTYSWEQDTDYFITVAGEWGWSENAPEDIKQAAVRYSGYLYHQKDAGIYDVSVFPEAGIITTPQGIPRDVRLLLAPYVRGPG